jgi:twitching motility protein PilT
LDGAIEELVSWPILDEEDLEGAVATITAHLPQRRTAFEETGEMDLGFESNGVRFRINAFRQRGSISVACRVIRREVPTLSSLHMPPGVERLGQERRGLVLVTGATGAGKSTTLAALVDHINRTRTEHIITIEDPIEMLLSDRKCIINQREVGIDTASFSQALRRALRQDPDVILIGELRDAETAETALQAAESGHLVLSTLHTVDASETIGRMIDFFPAEKQPMIRAILASVLKGVVSQRLLPKPDGGRVAAVEVMVVNDRISDLIRESRMEELPAAIDGGAYYGMQTLSQALIELAASGIVDHETAANAAPNRHDFFLHLEKELKTRAANRDAQDPGGGEDPFFTSTPPPESERDGSALLSGRSSQQE